MCVCVYMFMYVYVLVSAVLCFSCYIYKEAVGWRLEMRSCASVFVCIYVYMQEPMSHTKCSSTFVRLYVMG